MARFVDLDDADEDPSSDVAQTYRHRLIANAHHPASTEQPAPLDRSADRGQDEGVSGVGFAAVLACYPVASSLATYLDLNDLHSLSLTCRSIHQNLTQYRRRLIADSLRCTFEDRSLLSDLRQNQLSKLDAHNSRSAENSIHLSQHGQFTSSYKISGCARDLVAECRKCGIVVCRNCVVKPPSNKYLEERHRRLCRPCLDAPFSAHLEPLKEELLHCEPLISGASSMKSTRSLSDSSHNDEEVHNNSPDSMDSATLIDAFTSIAFLRDACKCSKQGVYLCAACGHNLRANDTTYRRVWTWRSRYSMDGLGTGLGIGDQGQKCGRGDHCLDPSTSSVSWVEIDCSDRKLDHGSDADSISGSRAGTPSGHRATPGYLQQEIEGIGGVVKKKVRKRVKTGATVQEYDDERKSGKYLSREINGKERSWCGWCERVCPGEQDHPQV